MFRRPKILTWEFNSDDFGFVLFDRFFALIEEFTISAKVKSANYDRDRQFIGEINWMCVWFVSASAISHIASNIQKQI